MQLHFIHQILFTLLLCSDFEWACRTEELKTIVISLTEEGMHHL